MARKPTDEEVELNGGHGWTFKTILAYMLSVVESNDRRYLEMFQSQDKAVAAALAAAEKAVNAALAAADKAMGKAEESQQRVNIGQNEFRGQLKDQAATFITRDVMDSVLARLGLVERTQAASAGEKVSKSDSRALVFSLAALAAAALSILARFFIK